MKHMKFKLLMMTYWRID